MQACNQRLVQIDAADSAQPRDHTIDTTADHFPRERVGSGHETTRTAV